MKQRTGRKAIDAKNRTEQFRDPDYKQRIEGRMIEPSLGSMNKEKCVNQSYINRHLDKERKKPIKLY